MPPKRVGKAKMKPSASCHVSRGTSGTPSLCLSPAACILASTSSGSVSGTRNTLTSAPAPLRPSTAASHSSLAWPYVE